MKSARRQLPLFPADGAVQVVLPTGAWDGTDELLMDLLIAVFEATREGNPTPEGDRHGENHPSAPCA
jgi:hypothetical protein